MAKEKTWKTKDGRILKLSEMESQHLVNSIAMMRRNGFIAYYELDLMLSSLGPRGEIAQYYFQSELLRAMDRAAPIIDAMEAELKRRGEG